MSLLEQLNEHMKQAMREKDKDRLSVIRMVKASLQNEAINLGVDQLSNEDELTILTREVKQRNESLKEFASANRDDLVRKIEKELSILNDYMPEQLTEQELNQIIQEVITKVNANSKQDFGKVMGALMPQVKGKADGATVQKLVQQHLQS